MNVFGMNETEREKVKKERKLIRNEFETVGKYGLPLIRKQEINVDKVELWGGVRHCSICRLRLSG